MNLTLDRDIKNKRYHVFRGTKYWYVVPGMYVEFGIGKNIPKEDFVRMMHDEPGTYLVQRKFESNHKKHHHQRKQKHDEQNHLSHQRRLSTTGSIIGYYYLKFK